MNEDFGFGGDEFFLGHNLEDQLGWAHSTNDFWADRMPKNEEGDEDVDEHADEEEDEDGQLAWWQERALDPGGYDNTDYWLEA